MYGKGNQEIYEAKTNGRQTNLQILFKIFKSSQLIDRLQTQISKDIDI